MAQYNITIDSEILHHLFLNGAKHEEMAKLLESVLNQILQAQASEQIKGKALRHLLGQSGDQYPFISFNALAYLANQVVDLPSIGCTTTLGTTSPVGLMICSTTRDDLLSSYGPGVALT